MRLPRTLLYWTLLLSLVASLRPLPSSLAAVHLPTSGLWIRG